MRHVRTDRDYPELMDSDFLDEDTPLPQPAVAHRDPVFPTGRIPRISDADDGAESEADVPDLYPRWRFVSPCTTVEDLARLYAPHFSGCSLFVFTPDSGEIGARVTLEMVLCTGERVMSASATVTEVRSAGRESGVRFAISSVSPDSTRFLAELGESADPLREMATRKMHALPPVGSRESQVPVSPPTPPSYRDIATMKMFALPLSTAGQIAPLEGTDTVAMSSLEIADAMGADGAGRVPEWSELLPCRLVIGQVGECEINEPGATPHITGRTVIADTSRGELAEVGEEDNRDEAPVEVESPPDPLTANDEVIELDFRNPFRWWIAGGVLVVVVAAAVTLMS